jgi:hypothetical protein
MSKQLILILALILMIICGLGSLALNRAVDRAADIASQELARPDSTMDLVIRSRTTAAAGQRNGVWAVGFFALAVVGAAVYTLYRMRLEAEAAREQRRLLAEQRKAHSSPRPTPPLPALGQPQYLRLNGTSPPPYVPREGDRYGHQ